MSLRAHVNLKKYSVDEILEAIDFEYIASYINENYPGGFSAFAEDYGEIFDEYDE